MTRFVLISDTHNTKPVLPRGDILVHAGDLTVRGTRAETEAAMLWLGLQAMQFKFVVFVGGNHDWFLYHLSREAGKDAVRDFVRPWGSNIIYLENELWAEEFEGKVVSFWGSPAQPEFCDWAWNYARDSDIRAVWDKIPTFGVDVLVTHGPPYHVLDWVGKDRVGCQDLRDAIDRVQPKVHVFGHIHAGHGKAQTFSVGGATTQCYNAAVTGENYKLAPKHHPWVLDYDGKTFTEVPGA